ncbi:MAG: queuosine precursor transporter [Candidatus Dependentiae bacterium]|nr:queuosine precursor transporter [Candidatus Dependentiae bacterium]
MYNELLFAAHIIVASASVLWALRYSYGALIAVLSLQLILANLFVTKQIMVFGIETTCSEVFVVSGMYGISLIRSYYGDAAARKAIWITFGFLLLFVFFVQLHCAYSGLDPILSVSIAQMCSATFRLFFASLAAYLVSERAHLALTRLWGTRHASPIGQIVAIAGGQVVDTVTFASLGLYGLVADLSSVILFCLIIKAIILVMLSPILALTYRYAVCRHERQPNTLKVHA